MMSISVLEEAAGPLVDATPAGRPGPVRLIGRWATIEKLDPDRDGHALWQAVRDHDRLWTYMAYGPFEDECTFVAWLAERAALSDPYSYAVSETGGPASGIVTLMAIRPAMRVIEIGSIVLAPALQQTAAASEAQYLMAGYVFDDLGYRRYEWKCNARNEASKRAALRLGFAAEGVFRNHMIVKGRSRDTAWFAMTDDDWPPVRAAFAQWLAPDNFDGAGRQKKRLSELMGKRGSRV